MNANDYRPLVLIIEDDPDTRELYRVVLEMTGYRTAEAAGIDESLQLIEHERPDVAICDWLLPDGDGFALCDQVQHIRAERRLPIIAITGVTLSAKAIVEASRAGIARVLQKPVLPDALVETVECVLTGDTARLPQAATVDTQGV